MHRVSPFDRISCATHNSSNSKPEKEGGSVPGPLDGNNKSCVRHSVRHMQRDRNGIWPIVDGLSIDARHEVEDKKKRRLHDLQ